MAFFRRVDSNGLYPFLLNLVLRRLKNAPHMVRMRAIYHKVLDIALCGLIDLFDRFKVIWAIYQKSVCLYCKRDDNVQIVFFAQVYYSQSLLFILESLDSYVFNVQFFKNIYLVLVVFLCYWTFILVYMTYPSPLGPIRPTILYF